jgi:hypothetical protein
MFYNQCRDFMQAVAPAFPPGMFLSGILSIFEIPVGRKLILKEGIAHASVPG